MILARIFENETDFVRSWLRPSPNQFNITYDNGKRYEPDFVVESNNNIYLVEVKADNQLDDPVVLSKKERALTYCNLVSSWAKETNHKEWKYIIIPASKITQSSTFKHLVELYTIVSCFIIFPESKIDISNLVPHTSNTPIKSCSRNAKKAKAYLYLLEIEFIEFLLRNMIMKNKYIFIQFLIKLIILNNPFSKKFFFKNFFFIIPFLLQNLIILSDRIKSIVKKD